MSTTAKSIRCPYCGSAAGLPCTSATGAETAVHASRVALARIDPARTKPGVAR